MHNDIQHSIIYNRENRRMVNLNMIKGYAVITNNVYKGFAITQAARANV